MEEGVHWSLVSFTHCLICGICSFLIKFSLPSPTLCTHFLSLSTIFCLSLLPSLPPSRSSPFPSASLSSSGSSSLTHCLFKHFHGHCIVISWDKTALSLLHSLSLSLFLLRSFFPLIPFSPGNLLYLSSAPPLHLSLSKRFKFKIQIGFS